MPKGLCGSLFVLEALPIWASGLILYGLTLFVIPIARDLFEGLPYQVAYSAQIGDPLLIGAVLIAATILQRGQPLPDWVASRAFNLVSVLVGIGVGLAWLILSKTTRFGDLYHNAVVVPLMLYLGITVAPVVAFNGTRPEKAWVILLTTSWLICVLWDFASGRLNQRDWLSSHGVTLRR